MNDFSAIDGFLNTFITYIDSGFGLISGDVTSLAAILIVIDVTLAALFWAWGQNDILQSLVKKTLYVGAFAFIFGNFATLSTIVFDSFATLGLNASAATLAPADLLKPGLVAAEGLSASQPIFDHIGTIAPGPFEFFGNLTEVILLCLGGIIVIAAFFVLSIQLFVLVVEFKITTLAGFVLVPFAFWKQTTFLAERVLGNVISSGIKVLVIAVVIQRESGGNLAEILGNISHIIRERLKLLGNRWLIEETFQPDFGRNNGFSKEKNWQFFEHNDQLYCVYQDSPERKIIRSVISHSLGRSTIRRTGSPMPRPPGRLAPSSV